MTRCCRGVQREGVGGRGMSWRTQFENLDSLDLDKISYRVFIIRNLRQMRGGTSPHLPAPSTPIAASSSKEYNPFTIHRVLALMIRSSLELFLSCVLKSSEESANDVSEGYTFDNFHKENSIPAGILQDDTKMTGVYDKVIDLCRTRERDDWKKLITLSTKWPQLSKGIFDRIQQRGRMEDDPEKHLEWIQFGRALLNVHKEIERYDGLIALFMATGRLEWETILSERRPEMTPAFFAHMHQLVQAGNEEEDKQESFKTMASALMSLVEMYDQSTKDKKSLDYAKDAIQDILEASSIEEADLRIDQLASNGGLDGAFLLTMAKMYMSVKESPYTCEETKDIMYHFYIKSKERAASMLPDEIRILKHLLSIEDPLQLKQSIYDAFISGEVASTSLDFLSTTPQKLLQAIDTVLRTYEMNKGKHSTLGQTSDMMNPAVIQRMRKLEAYIKKEFM